MSEPRPLWRQRARGVKLGGYRDNSPDIRLHQAAGVKAAAMKAATYADLVRPLAEGLRGEGLSLRAIPAEPVSRVDDEAYSPP